MSAKIILFDVDGVLIRFPHYFSREVEKNGYKDAAEIMDSFFDGNDYHQCLIGKAEVRKMATPYLKKIGWEESAENYFQEQFKFESLYLDKKLISFIEELKNKGIICNLATDQDENRLNFLLNNLNFKNIFNKCFASCNLGYR